MKVENDQQCNIKLDAYPDEQFTGKVTKKGNMVKDSTFTKGVKIVEVEITIDGEHTYLRPGMTTTVEIVLDRVKNALYVPLTSVFEEEGEYFCYVRNGTGHEKRKVKLGKSTTQQVVINKGLREEETVALFEPAP